MFKKNLYFLHAKVQVQMFQWIQFFKNIFNQSFCIIIIYLFATLWIFNDPNERYYYLLKFMERCLRILFSGPNSEISLNPRFRICEHPSKFSSSFSNCLYFVWNDETKFWIPKSVNSSHLWSSLFQEVVHLYFNRFKERFFRLNLW